MSLDEKIKRIGRNSLLELVKEHKDTCQGHCNISLVCLRLWLEDCGIEFEEDEGEIMI